MSAVTDYSGLITSQHRDKPLFIACVELLCSGPSDLQNVLASLPGLLDLDTAISAQLDAIGVWVGFGRYQFVPGLGTVTLADIDYRTLLRAKILANHWDGTFASLQLILGSLFPGTPTTLFATDNQDMTMDIYLIGSALTATQLALLKGGLLAPKPEGVHLNGIIQITGPLFGLDFNNAVISGPDIGSFPSYL